MSVTNWPPEGVTYTLVEPLPAADVVEMAHPTLEGFRTYRDAAFGGAPWSRAWLLHEARRAVGSAYPADAVDVDSPSPGLVVIYLRLVEPFGAWAEHISWIHKNGARAISECLEEVPLGLTLRVLASPCIEHRGAGPDDPDACASNHRLGLACARGR